MKNSSRPTYRLYGFDECPWCAKAIDLLLFEDADLEMVKLATREERVAWMNDRGFIAPDRTFPKVYRVENGIETLIGGYTDLEAFLKTPLAA